MVALIVRILFRMLFRVTVRGELQKHDKLLIVANHTSFLDGILLGAFLPVQPTWLVHTTIAKIWYFKLGLQFLPHLVVDSASPFVMKAVIGLLEAGKPVVIFPEGRITVTGTLMKIYDGPAFVAAKAVKMFPRPARPDGRARLVARPFACRVVPPRHDGGDVADRPRKPAV